MKQSQQCNIISERLEQQVKRTEAMVKLLIIWSPRRFSRWRLLPVKFGGLRKTNPAHIKNSGVSFICTFTCTSLTSFLYYSSFYKKKYISPAYVVISFYLAMSLFQHCVAYWNFPSRAFRREFFLILLLYLYLTNLWMSGFHSCTEASGANTRQFRTVSFRHFCARTVKDSKFTSLFFPYSSKAHVSFQLCTRFPKNLIYSLWIVRNQ